MSDRPRAGGGGRGRQFTSEDWERGAAQSGFKFLDRLGQSAIRNGERQMRHEQKMEDRGYREAVREHQRATREAQRDYRAERQHEMRMEQQAARPESRRPGVREYDGGERNMRPGTRPSEYRQPQPDPSYGPRSDAGQYTQASHRTAGMSREQVYGGATAGQPGGKEVINGSLSGNGPLSEHMNIPTSSRVMPAGNRQAQQEAPQVAQAQTGAIVTPVREPGKIETRPLPTAKEDFKVAAHNPRADQNAPKHAAPAADAKVASASPAKLTEDTRDYTTVVVSKGDNLWKLSETMYGKQDAKTTQNHVNAIAEANGWDAKRAGNLKPGEEIKFPDVPRVTPDTPNVAGKLIVENTVAPAQAPTQIASIKMDSPGMG